jgi:signal transduction histidine kinase
MKILIAEDQTVSRMVLEEWAAVWGYDIISTPDGQAAWDILQGQAAPPRLILLDWMMPNLDGISLCQRIKQTDAGLPYIYVILLTSRNSTEDIVTGLDAGADDFLSKPVQPQELQSRLKVGARILNYQQRLEELDAQKNKFLGMAAHDLRNPLNSIIGFSEVLQDKDIDQATHDEFLGIIHRVSNDMLNTLNDLLDISMIESGHFEIRKKTVSLAELLSYHVHLNHLEAARKNIQLQLELPITPLTLTCDPMRIGQVIDNLLSNALKFSPPSTQVILSAKYVEQDIEQNSEQNNANQNAEQHSGHYVEIAVQDQGPGIPMSKQTQLFGTFSKLGIRPTGGEKSTGLGLAIVKKIVLAHGGNIGVDSTPGQGSRFSVRLPA